MQDDKKSNLEKYVTENKQAFDQDGPTRDLWPEIDQRILRSPEPTYRKEVWLWRAASIVLLMVSAFLVYDKTDSSKQIDGAAIEANSEFDQVENFYVAQISEKRTQIDTFIEKNIQVDEAYELDLARLDAMYEVLKEELKKNPESKEIKDALTLNLLVRIDVLNNQLQEIEEVEEEIKQAT